AARRNRGFHQHSEIFVVIDNNTLEWALANRERTPKPASPSPTASVVAPTVATLLSRAELGLELVTGDENAPFRAVRNAESATHRPWLSQSDLRLTDAPFGLPRPASDPVLWPPPSALVYGLVPQRRALPP